ncbi:MAG TPA: type I polyketide synthase, partial [Kouleothrix sp.]|nr:type I polyketide synthase [Kouleothrix sp.]
ERVASRAPAERPAADAVAIVAMSGRFPGAPSVEAFWRNLCDGVESIVFFSDEELLAAGIEPELVHNPSYVKGRAALDGIELFDAAFFGYTPREAELIDPQQRIFLECAWEALERAGYDPQRFPGRVGVFAGVSMNSYVFNLYSNPAAIEAAGSFQAVLSNDKDYLATRVAYKLNLRGASFTVQSACSTSLVATHLACQSLLSGDSDMALAGGVSALVPQTSGHLYSEGGIASPDGHCRAFDAQARGTVSGSGVAIVVLKRLADALADGDQIYAVIKGSAINNDGAGKVGYTAPSVAGQAAVIAEAQARAGVPADTIGYVEAHGTGTPLGDPIEIQALTQAFRLGTARERFCAIGSLKTNIGHLDAAAGAAGLIKAALALRHGQIPPSLHFSQPNPQIDFARSPFYVATSLAPWPGGSHPRRAGVSSFGIGGTNVHMVLEEPPAQAPAQPSTAPQLLVLSAKTAPALEAATAQLAGYLDAHPGASLADVAFTLQAGRQAFAHRRAVVAG